MRFTDIHTHFQSGNFSVLDISEDFSKAVSAEFFSVGVHPKKEENSAEFSKTRELAAVKNCVAIGECGLDKFSPLPLNEQEKIFNAQIIVAQEFEKPLIIHCVRLYNEVLRLLKAAKFILPVVFHSYNGDPQTTKNLLKYQNINFSFSETSLKDGNKGLKSLEIIPLDRIFTESDMNPKTDFAKLLTKIAEVKRVGFQEVAQAVERNFSSFVIPLWRQQKI